MKIYAYGNKLLDKDVNLCNDNISELCPITQGYISTSGVHTVPTKYTSSISEVAYRIPDLEGTITIELYNASNLSQNLGCFHSSITNGKSTEQESVKYATLGIAAAALIISAVSSANGGAGGAGGATGGAPVPGVGHPMPTGTEASGAGGAGGSGAVASGPGTNVAAGGWHPPGFSEFFSVLQGIAVSGMYSVNYPSAYRSFTQNVGWSTGIITWAGMQTSIDDFRRRTGGNLTASSYERLKNTTLVYRDDTNSNITDISESVSSSSTTSTFKLVYDLYARGTTSSSSNSTTSSDTSSKSYVEIVTGIRAYVEKLTVPSTNTFMTLLIWFAIIVGICIAGILAVKLALEIWSLKGNEQKKYEGFRKRYHLFIASTLVRLTIIFYGLWVLYCFYQFKIGDSWGTRLLAGLVFAITTLVLLCFTIRIVWIAHIASKEKGGLEYLFKHKPWIRKYGLFYDQFKVKYWWCFIPSLLAVFGRNAFIALGYGDGLVQIIGQMVIDVLLVLLYIICMPFNTKMGNGINIAIQVVRLISLALLLTFAVQFNLNQIAATGIGMALLVIQAIMTILLIVLIMINAGVGIFRMTCGGRRKKQKAKKLEEERKRQQEAEGSLDSDSTRRVPSILEYENEKSPFTNVTRPSFNSQHREERFSDSIDRDATTAEIQRAFSNSSRLEANDARPGSVNPKSVRSSLAIAETMPAGNTAREYYEAGSNRNSVSESSSEEMNIFSESSNVDIPHATPETTNREMIVPSGLRQVFSAESPASPTKNFSRPSNLTKEQPQDANKRDSHLNPQPSKRHLLRHEHSSSGGSSEPDTTSLKSSTESGYNVETGNRNFI